MDTEKKTGERIGITLALLACVGFSAFLIWLQQSQENDRQQLTQQVQDSGQREEQTEGSGQIEIRSRVTRSKTGDQPVFSLPTRYNPQNSPSTNTRQPFRSSSVKSVISFNSSSSKTCLFLAT